MKKYSVNNKILNGLVAVTLLGSSNAFAVELLNSSYDVARELFSALNPEFEKQWNEQHPQDKLIIKQSHAAPPNKRWQFFRDCGPM